MIPSCLTHDHSFCVLQKFHMIPSTYCALHAFLVNNWGRRVRADLKSVRRQASAENPWSIYCASTNWRTRWPQIRDISRHSTRQALKGSWRGQGSMKGLEIWMHRLTMKPTPLPSCCRFLLFILYTIKHCICCIASGRVIQNMEILLCYFLYSLIVII